MNDKERDQLAAELLDAALARYGEVESRAGLEERVLANLQTQRLASRWFWWQWGPILAGATVIVATLFTVSIMKRSADFTEVTASEARKAENTKVNQQKASSLTAEKPGTQNQVGDNGPSGVTNLAVVPAELMSAREPITTPKREGRKPTSAAATVAPQLIAQQTKASSAEGLRIEELQIAEVALDEIVINK